MLPEIKAEVRFHDSSADVPDVESVNTLFGVAVEIETE
jgi:hypothetical protein